MQKIRFYKNYGFCNSCGFVSFVADLNDIKLICLIFGIRKFRKQDNRNILSNGIYSQKI